MMKGKLDDAAEGEKDEEDADSAVEGGTERSEVQETKKA
jgi:hypothetical protein